MTIEAAAWQRREGVRRDLALAWHQAALARAKRLPALKKLLGSVKEPQRPLDEAQKRARRDEFAELRRRMGER